MNRDQHTFFVTCPRHLEQLLAEELRMLVPARTISQSGSGAGFEGSVSDALTVCLWSRLAGRVLLELAAGPANDRDSLYALAAEIRWETHMDAHTTFSIAGHSSNRAFRNPNLPNLILKDALCDRLRELTGSRPDVSSDNPDIRLFLHTTDRSTSIFVDVSGGSLHRRGYRLRGGDAPLRENTAAGVLLRSGWGSAVQAFYEGVAERPLLFVDPMCGSGTIAIEAAMMAADIAPGLLHEESGLSHWKGNDPKVWKELRASATRRAREGKERLAGSGSRIWASDIEEQAIADARENAQRAGVGELITFAVSDIQNLPRGAVLGDRNDTPDRRTHFIVTNPPYGIRVHGSDHRSGASSVSDEHRAGAESAFYRDLGRRLGERFRGFSATVLAESEEQAKALGLQAKKLNRFFNGNREIVAARIDLTDENRFRENKRTRQRENAAADATDGIPMLMNRLRKNRRALKSLLKREGVTCYRLYDADIPQYAAAVDVYIDTGGRTRAVVQEYAPPKEIEAETADTRFSDIEVAVAEVLEIDGQTGLFTRRRERQRGKHQYEKLSSAASVVATVREGGLDFEVNFSDYLDTGLFCDQRITRAWIGEMAEGKSVLNLFAYTCSASVYAAAGGAEGTVSVDTSATYLDWGERNFSLNQLWDDRHRFVEEDAARFLERTNDRYDIIYIDPPTFSNSKDRREDFDVQRDHGRLVKLSAGMLQPGGCIIFSNNYRGFRLDPEITERFSVEDRSAATLPADFSRQAKRHHVYRIEQRR